MSAETSQHDQLLLPRRIRRPAGVLAVGCAVVCLALAVKYRGTSTGGILDRWVFHWLQQRDGIPFHVVSRLTGLVPPVFFLVVIALALATLVARRWRYAALVILGPGLSVLVVEVGKSIVGRTLDGMLAMPSGHTAAVTSVSLVVALLILDHLRSRVVAAAVLGLAAVTLMACVIAVLMVVGRFHYATDTIAGYCAAMATTLGVALAVDAVANRRSRPVAPDDRAARSSGSRLG